MRVLYNYMRYAENNKYYVSLMFFNNKKGNNNVENGKEDVYILLTQG